MLSTGTLSQQLMKLRYPSNMAVRQFNQFSVRNFNIFYYWNCAGNNRVWNIDLKVDYQIFYDIQVVGYPRPNHWHNLHVMVMLHVNGARSRGRPRPTYVDTLKRDTGVSTTQELANLMENSAVWRFLVKSWRHPPWLTDMLLKSGYPTMNL